MVTYKIKHNDKIFEFNNFNDFIEYCTEDKSRINDEVECLYNNHYSLLNTVWKTYVIFLTSTGIYSNVISNLDFYSSNPSLMFKTIRFEIWENEYIYSIVTKDYPSCKKHTQYFDKYFDKIGFYNALTVIINLIKAQNMIAETPIDVSKIINEIRDQRPSEKECSDCRLYQQMSKLKTETEIKDFLTKELKSINIFSKSFKLRQGTIYLTDTSIARVGKFSTKLMCNQLISDVLRDIFWEKYNEEKEKK